MPNNASAGVGTSITFPIGYVGPGNVRSITTVSSGSVRPTSGQLWPRGTK
jgi:hypothetical protein